MLFISTNIKKELQKEINEFIIIYKHRDNFIKYSVLLKDDIVKFALLLFFKQYSFL